jgi:hypothetical protein
MRQPPPGTTSHMTRALLAGRVRPTHASRRTMRIESNYDSAKPQSGSECGAARATLQAAGRQASKHADLHSPVGQMRLVHAAAMAKYAAMDMNTNSVRPRRKNMLWWLASVHVYVKRFFCSGQNGRARERRHQGTPTHTSPHTPFSTLHTEKRAGMPPPRGLLRLSHRPIIPHPRILPHTFGVTCGGTVGFAGGPGAGAAAAAHSMGQRQGGGGQPRFMTQPSAASAPRPPQALKSHPQKPELGSEQGPGGHNHHGVPNSGCPSGCGCMTPQAGEPRPRGWGTLTHLDSAPGLICTRTEARLGQHWAPRCRRSPSGGLRPAAAHP